MNNKIDVNKKLTNKLKSKEITPNNKL